jgi:hypothetical protein
VARLDAYQELADLRAQMSESGKQSIAWHRSLLQHRADLDLWPGGRRILSRIAGQRGSQSQRRLTHSTPSR